MLFVPVDIYAALMQIIWATSLTSPLISKTTVNTAYDNQANVKLKHIPNVFLVNAFLRDKLLDQQVDKQ